ncbi:flagellar hook-length control protein FliK [Gimesia panareensis]|uniref:flagellar hook-length control protein FliK n=1 Tax=Gimesia panareensis TaxID=2527978 RepID=UPI00118B1274|nr:flagellar hook-length control protein FliK [Gimesia panareensis]QDU49727.1 Flagellar hook-length control protein FliK [Gimesia panareensis]
MADSPKFSLLDLQTPDVSQYGKQNLGLQRETTRSTDSSYRKQLTESLSRKQQRSSNDKPQVESRSASDNKPERSRPEPQDTQSRPAPEPRDTTSSVADHDQQKVRPQDRGDDRTEVSRDDADQAAPVPEQKPAAEDKNDSAEVSENVVTVQPEVKTPVKEKAPGYSLFHAATQSEGTLTEEVTTGETEIRPPANFQFTDNQSLVKLQTDVTETQQTQSLPIPEGLAELLKKQEVSTTQTDATAQGESAKVPVEDQQVQAADQSEELINAVADDQSPSDETQPEVSLDTLKQIKMTDELKAAIQKFQEQQSKQGNEKADASQADQQAALQQRYLNSQQQQNADNGNQQQGQDAAASDQNTGQQASQTVIDQVQQQADQTGPDKTEVSDKKTEKHADTDKNLPDQSALNQAPHQLKPAATDALQKALTEATKPNPLTQEQHAANPAGHDQSHTQTAGLGHATNVATDHQAAPAGPVVDAKQVDQLVDRISSAVRQSQSTGQQLKIRLSPPELGTLQIEVSLKNGEYSAKLEVQNRHAQKVINDNIAQLKDALTKTGVSLDRIDVHINTHSSEDQRSSQSDSQQQSGTEFNSNQFSDQSGDTEQGHDERSFVEETIQRDDVEPEQQNRPHVTRSQGVATDNVEEIDVQI